MVGGYVLNCLFDDNLLGSPVLRGDLGVPLLAEVGLVDVQEVDHEIAVSLSEIFGEQKMAMIEFEVVRGLNGFVPGLQLVKVIFVGEEVVKAPRFTKAKQELKVVDLVCGEFDLGKVAKFWQREII